MTTLTTKKRNALPKKDFALPKERKYPVQDKAHAINAKARAAQQEKKGNLTPAQKQKIDAAANKVIKKKK